MQLEMNNLDQQIIPDMIGTTDNINSNFIFKKFKVTHFSIFIMLIALMFLITILSFLIAFHNSNHLEMNVEDPSKGSSSSATDHSNLTNEERASRNNVKEEAPESSKGNRVLTMKQFNLSLSIQINDDLMIMDGSCNFFRPYPHVSGIYNLLFNLKYNFSLHGYWPNYCNFKPVLIGNKLNKRSIKHCLSYSEFTNKFNKSMLHFYMISGLPSDYSTMYCCNFQFHEYIKHGCSCGLSYDDWYDYSLFCSEMFQHFLLKTYYVVNCPTCKTYLPLEQTTDQGRRCQNCDPGFHEGYFKSCDSVTCHG